ncbi:MAG: heme-copper oxidase subunit III [Planctomycetota bacterium]
MNAATISPSMNTLPRRAVDARIGMMIFLASWGMVFLTLFFSFSIYRFQAPVWPPVDGPGLGTGAFVAAVVNTSLVLISGMLLFLASRSIGKATQPRIVTYVGGTILLGIAFLGIQINTWIDLWESGVRLQSGIYPALFYALTIFHALHVFAGIVTFLFVLPSVRALSSVAALASNRDAVTDQTRFAMAAMFWHFVAVAWFATFFIVYII